MKRIAILFILVSSQIICNITLKIRMHLGHISRAVEILCPKKKLDLIKITTKSISKKNAE
jgi:hypothetical protein